MYSSVPNLMKWKLDSSVLDPRVQRATDKVLCQIDEIVAALQGRPAGESTYLMAELFFATNYWLRNFRTYKDEMHPGREGAILNLFTLAANKLTQAFGCTINTLPRELEWFFGTGLTAHGTRQDTKAFLGTLHYLQRAVAARFKVAFKNGLAYGMPLNSIQALDMSKVELLSTWDSYDRTADKKTLRLEFAPFAMSMSRDLYVGPHRTFHGSLAEVHSSWLAGQSVLCAGSICIEKGVVTGLQPNSGHYQPSQGSLVNVLSTLRMHGVDLKQVEIYAYSAKDRDDPVCNGEEFVARQGNWATFKGIARDNQDKQAKKLQLLNDFKDFKAGRKTLNQVVQKQFQSFKAQPGASGKSDQAIWKESYVDICNYFHAFDPSGGWLEKARHPIPMRPTQAHPPMAMTT